MWFALRLHLIPECRDGACEDPDSQQPPISGLVLSHPSHFPANRPQTASWNMSLDSIFALESSLVQLVRLGGWQKPRLFSVSRFFGALSNSHAYLSNIDDRVSSSHHVTHPPRVENKKRKPIKAKIWQSRCMGAKSCCIFVADPYSCTLCVAAQYRCTVFT